jgi:hypothetical protein
MISGFHHHVDKICTLLGYYAVSDFLTLEDGTDTLSENIGKGVPLDTA